MKPRFNSWGYQEVLEAAAALQLRRAGVVAALEAGECPDGVRVVGRGPTLNDTMMAESRRWRHLLSVRQITTAADLRVSLPNNRRRLASGLRMTSLFDWSATTAAARAMLSQEASGVYFFTRAPMQLKVVDLREVFVQGPVSWGEPAVVAVTDPAVLDAAMRYWHLVQRDAAPAWTEDGADGFTPRQRRVLELMRQDLTDQGVADVLGISLRTVRYEVAAILATLGVQSRFSAGLSLGASSPPAD